LEELEETARLYLMTNGHQPAPLTEDQIQALRDEFDVKW
jgi:hypothetical protein